MEKVKSSINTEQVVNYLSHAFSKACQKASPTLGTRATRVVVDGKVETTKLYDYQIKFMYLLNEIQRGPVYIVPKLIQTVNEMIAEIENL